MLKKENLIGTFIALLLICFAVFLLSNEYSAIFQLGIGTMLILMTALWLLSLKLKDAGIVDIFWGIGFVIIAWLYAFASGLETLGIRNFILLAMISIWGLRLAIYLAIRNIGKSEDYRYAAWRKENGKNWWWYSFFKVFALQGFLLWIIAAVFLPALKVQGGLELWDYVGIGFWAIGFFFEAVSDWQMMQFKKYAINRGKVMDQGLWKYTRHPNYFGEAMMWWGFFFFSLVHPDAIYYIFCPLLMTFLLLKVSGVAMLEEGLKKSKPKYESYIRRTSAFLPWWPKE